MTEDIKLLGSLFERGKLLEELIFGELLRRETAFVFVVGVHILLHVDGPFAGWRHDLA
jgi:hypothetical protein